MERNRPFVLVVDNAVDGAESMAELLAAWGYDSATEYSGGAALETARGRMSFAVVLDLGMAPMDGFAFAAQFRGIPGSGESLIVAISGRSLEVNRTGQPQSGIDHHLSKPADAKLLRGLLERHRGAGYAVPIRGGVVARHATTLRPVTGASIAAYRG